MGWVGAADGLKFGAAASAEHVWRQRACGDGWGSQRSSALSNASPDGGEAVVGGERVEEKRELNVALM